MEFDNQHIDKVTLKQINVTMINTRKSPHNQAAEGWLIIYKGFSHVEHMRNM